MSTIGSPIDTSLVQAAQAQQTASKTKDRERAASEQTQRYKDMLELRVAGIEAAEAARHLPHSDREEADHEREARKQAAKRDKGGEGDDHIDVTA